MSSSLKARGYCVCALNYVATIRAATGATKVDPPGVRDAVS
jgi:hypothetical protein